MRTGNLWTGRMLKNETMSTMFGKVAPLDSQKEHIFLAEVLCCAIAVSKYVLEIEKVVVWKVLQWSAFQDSFSYMGLFLFKIVSLGWQKVAAWKRNYR